MNIRTIAAIIFSFFIASSALAAIEYPTIAGITISESTSAAEYLIYFFNLAVAAGTFIAVIMVIMAGIEWVTSSGNPGKVESAKSKLTNTVFGVMVLLGCYLVLNAINPQLTNIKIGDLSCEHGIVVLAKQASDGKIDQKCIDSNQTDIVDTILSTVKWSFADNYLLKAYTYPQTNYAGTPTEYDCSSGTCSGDITGAKSIYFVLNKPGIYLYDDNSYKPGVKSYPLFTSTSIADLAGSNSFDNFTKSIEIVNPDQAVEPVQYMAVVFEKQNYKGRCAFVAQSVPDMDQAPNGYYTDNVGDDTISSIIVAKANLDQATINEKRGEVILYTKTYCGKSTTDSTSQIKACHIPIYNASEGQKNILEYCKGQGFVSGDEVMSFEITGAAGLVLSTSELNAGSSLTSCEYFNKSSLNEGTCKTSIRNSSIFTVGGEIPKSFIVLPEN